MRKKLILTAAIFFFISSGMSVSLEEGWNTISVNSEMSEESLVENSGCNLQPLPNSDKYVLEWDSESEELAHTEDLVPWKGYYVWTSDQCNLGSGEYQKQKSLSLEKERWNLIRRPSGLYLGDIKDACSLEPIEENGYDYFTLSLKGDKWNYDYQTENGNNAIWVWPSKDCTVEYNSKSGSTSEPRIPEEPDNTDEEEQTDEDRSEESNNSPVQETASGWELEKSTLESREDSMKKIAIAEKPYELDTGNTGFCGEVYLRKEMEDHSIVNIDYRVVANVYAGSIGVWVDDEVQNGYNPSGDRFIEEEGTWSVEAEEGKTVRVGIKDTNSQYCNNLDHYADLDINDITVREVNEDSSTYKGEPRSDYRYTGDEQEEFEEWKAGEITTHEFRTSTDSGQGTAALELKED